MRLIEVHVSNIVFREIINIFFNAADYLTFVFPRFIVFLTRFHSPIMPMIEVHVIGTTNLGYEAINR